MSMLSDQCDELRNAADKLDERAKAYVPTGRNVLSPMLRDAADTIWELRNDCVELRKERDELKKLADAQALDLECMTFNRDTLHTENANLRVLCHDMYQYTTNREMELCNACVEADGDFADCAACDDYDGACGIAKRRFEELYQERMRELGIEADT